MQAFIDFFIVALFGKRGQEGYYRPATNKQQKKDYVLASIFPSYEMMETLLAEEENGGDI